MLESIVVRAKASVPTGTGRLEAGGVGGAWMAGRAEARNGAGASPPRPLNPAAVTTPLVALAPEVRPVVLDWARDGRVGAGVESERTIPSASPTGTPLRAKRDLPNSFVSWWGNFIVMLSTRKVVTESRVVGLLIRCVVFGCLDAGVVMMGDWTCAGRGGKWLRAATFQVADRFHERNRAVPRSGVRPLSGALVAYVSDAQNGLRMVLVEDIGRNEGLGCDEPKPGDVWLIEASPL